MSWFLVALGGAIGASLRYSVAVFLLKSTNAFPWTTWWINILGCLFAGIFFAYSQKFPVLQNEARLFLMVGILGGFTTFSSFGLETFQLLKQGQIILALGYAVSSVLVGVLVLALGFYVFQWLLGAGDIPPQ